MPRERSDWFTNNSFHDDNNGQFHARQSCTYYSVININRSIYPHSSSFEREQTWTLTQTLSNASKRYLSSIENIYLTKPSVLTLANGDHKDAENDQHRVARSISLLPPLPPSRQHALAIHRLNRENTGLSTVQHSRPTNHSSSKNIFNLQKSHSMNNSMRLMHVNGEFVVRI